MAVGPKSFHNKYNIAIA